jgi:hypothetical protein
MRGPFAVTPCFLLYWPLKITDPGWGAAEMQMGDENAGMEKGCWLKLWAPLEQLRGGMRRHTYSGLGGLDPGLCKGGTGSQAISPLE